MPLTRRVLAPACALVLLWAAAAPVRAADAVDVGSTVPKADQVSEGLFPEEKCEELKAAGYKCQGFKPTVKYSLPATSFKLGSAELPELLKQQLEVFAEVLKSRRGTGKTIRIEGHADASGSEEFNQVLSKQRAEAVKDFLVAHGADPDMLATAGAGASELKNAANPFAAENRRVEIGRATAP
jgi:outer membrane protein OmpA-like peptidoglycan-associated protein